MRGWPEIGASKRTAASVESQSCVSCGETWNDHAQLAGIGVDGADGRGVKVVAFAIGEPDDGLRIAGCDIDHVEIGIVSDRLPGHAATVRGRILIGPGFHAGITLFHRHGIELPLHFASFGIVGFDEAGDIHIVAAYARNDMVSDHHRRD